MRSPVAVLFFTAAAIRDNRPALNLLAEGAAPVAGSVTVTGANGQNSNGVGSAGAGGLADRQPPPQATTRHLEYRHGDRRDWRLEHVAVVTAGIQAALASPANSTATTSISSGGGSVMPRLQRHRRRRRCRRRRDTGYGRHRRKGQFERGSVERDQDRRPPRPELYRRAQRDWQAISAW